MSNWNGIAKNDVVYCYNIEHTVLALYEQNGKQMCRLERIGDESIRLDVDIEMCRKA